MQYCNSIQHLIFILPIIHALPVLPRLSLSDGWSSYYDRDYADSDAYVFGYDLEDAITGNVQFRQEERFPNGTVSGSYGFLEPDGNIKIAHYTADNYGYRVFIENSRGTSMNYPPITMPLEEYKDQFSNYDMYPSDELLSAMESTVTLGQPIQEQHTPPKHYEDFDEWPNNIGHKGNYWNQHYDDMNSYVYK
ncbi:uncharacterized protein [Rhodnius prolixus]|uniref:uncharacterized protein n=1 Tax=Rhodnius prolixus TaxID=13249 RepID=UPI003D18B2BC